MLDLRRPGSIRRLGSIGRPSPSAPATAPEQPNPDQRQTPAEPPSATEPPPQPPNTPPNPHRRLGWPNSRKSVALVCAGALLVAAGVVFIWTKASGPGSDSAFLANADRVLQSVQVNMSPDARLTSVDGTVVGTTTDKTQFSHKTQYSPRASASDLPVRVQTSYRTPKRSGTNLSDLSGYDGPVQIQLTVQNLTVKPRRLSYDVDGNQKSRTALVGVPLTIVASSALNDVKPSAVRVNRAGNLAGTNGVLSQNQNGVPQVQWATVLAPPHMRSSSTLTLSLNAHDFRVPDFNLSVEPGLVTDPSIGGLIDDAFNPTGSSQLRLEQRTINLIGRVNLVLASAGKTIDRVRSTLNDSAANLGTRTVSDLKTSASTITASVRGLHSSVSSLGQDLTANLKSTRSNTVRQLRQMVRTVDGMLGDTSAKAPTAALSGNGCGTAVADTKNARSMYGDLLQVVGQLNGYAKATDSCKQQLRSSMLKTVGPANPDSASCLGSTSATCSLLGAENSFLAIATKLVADGDTAVAALNPGTANHAVDAANKLTAATADVHAALGQGHPVWDSLGRAKNAATAVKAALDSVHSQAIAGQSGVASLGQLNTSLGTRICEMLSSGDLSSDAAAELRSYVASTTCPDSNGASTPQTGPSGQTPMDQQIQNQANLWDALAADTVTTDTDKPAGQSLAELTSALDDLEAAISGQSDGSGQGNGDKQDLSRALNDLDRASTVVNKQVHLVQQQQNGVKDAVHQAFSDAANATKSEAATNVDQQIRQISDQAATNAATLGAMFDRSRAGLHSAARAITRNGARSINKQRDRFVAQQRSAGRHISHSIDRGLSRVSRGVSASTRDMTAANSLLSQDLRNVLLDLGTRRVNGSGLLGSMSTSAATANSAGYQLSQASRTASSYANVRRGDIAGILLRQAQTDAAMRLQARMPPFRLRLPDSARHRTVYSFHVRGGG